jgi:hypothetical protein
MKALLSIGKACSKDLGRPGCYLAFGIQSSLQTRAVGNQTFCYRRCCLSANCLSTATLSWVFNNRPSRAMMGGARVNQSQRNWLAQSTLDFQCSYLTSVCKTWSSTSARNEGTEREGCLKSKTFKFIMEGLQLDNMRISSVQDT